MTLPFNPNTPCAPRVQSAQIVRFAPHTVLAHRALVGLCALATLLAACPQPGGPQAELPSSKNQVRRGHAPAPFSADELRKACPSGHFRRYLIEVPDQAPLLRTLSFEEATKDSVEVVSSQADTRGRPFGEQRRQRARWKALQAHASFPRRDTTIRKATLATGGGIFETWLYEVRLRGGLERERYWFARSLPGPPVQYERHVDGKLLFRMTLLSHGRQGPAQQPAPGAAPGTAPGAAPGTTPGPTPAPGPGPAPPRKKSPPPQPITAP